MRRVTLYSSARRPVPVGPSVAGGRAADGVLPSSAPLPAAALPAPVAPTPGAPWRWFSRRYGLLVVAGSGLLALIAMTVPGVRTLPPRRITQQDIDQAVLHTLATKSLPSRAAKAYAVIRPSVVEVRGWKDDERAKKSTRNDVGTGVVIVDRGIILTNLHVVSDAQRVEV